MLEMAKTTNYHMITTTELIIATVVIFLAGAVAGASVTKQLSSPPEELVNMVNIVDHSVD